MLKKLKCILSMVLLNLSIFWSLLTDMSLLLQWLATKAKDFGRHQLLLDAVLPILS